MKIEDFDTKYKKSDVENFIAYVQRLKTDKKRDGSLTNPWSLKISDAKYIELFERVAGEGLVLDGKHITIQNTGISYDYIAYKNKMYLKYPDTQFDVQLVKETDTFSFAKENGKITYTHEIKNPFGNEEIIGGYAVIKNKRGEFITLLSKEDIAKHRKVAKTDYIWREWFEEMALKTVVKKACKLHFSDIYSGIEKEDNENYDLDFIDLDPEIKNLIEKIDSVSDLEEFYRENKGIGKGFDKAIIQRKKELENENS
jgi:hypothetical protein